MYNCCCFDDYSNNFTQDGNNWFWYFRVVQTETREERLNISERRLYFRKVGVAKIENVKKKKINIQLSKSISEVRSGLSFKEIFLPGRVIYSFLSRMQYFNPKSIKNYFSCVGSDSGKKRKTVPFQKIPCVKQSLFEIRNV